MRSDSLKVGDLAKRTGISVRTLYYSDRRSKIFLIFGKAAVTASGDGVVCRQLSRTASRSSHALRPG